MKKAIRERESFIFENKELYENRDGIYKSVQDMTVSYNKTKNAMDEMREIKTQIKSNDTKISYREKRIGELEYDINRCG